MRIDVQVTGAHELAARLRQVDLKILDDAVMASAEEVAVQSKNFAPVLTGALRSSLAAERISPLVVGVGSDLDYARYQELGTLHLEPRGYMRRGLEAARGRIQRLLEEAAAKIARGVAGR